MQGKRIGFALVLVVMVSLSGCTLSASKDKELNAIQTSVAATLAMQETVESEREAFADGTATPTATVFYPTPDLSATFAATATKEVPCNLAGFVMDVTVPDGTLVSKGQIFTKTWKLQNIGTCAWTPAYQVVFMSGDQMNAMPQMAFTSIIVEPGEMVDVSVQMTAPTIAGEYQANFMLADEKGHLFSFENKSAFYAKISVPVLIDGTPAAPTPTGTLQSTQTNVITAVATMTATEPNGSDLELETLSIAPTLANTLNHDYFTNAFNFGDLTTDDGTIGFAQFSLSEIPAGAEIESVQLRIPSYTISGDPFGGLGCARVYFGYFYPLNNADYTFGTSGASGRACSSGELASIAMNPGVLASYVENGASAIDVKLMFNEVQSNGNGAADLVRASAGEVRLVVQYRP